MSTLLHTCKLRSLRSFQRLSSAGHRFGPNHLTRVSLNRRPVQLTRSLATTTATATDEHRRRVTDYYDVTATREGVCEDHMHQGYYGLGEPPDTSAIPSSQVRMIDEVLKFAGISDDPLKWPKNIVDVGSGFGASSRYFARKYGAHCCCINLSPAQNAKAEELAMAAGLGDKMSFIVGDALDQPFFDGQFDLVWSMDAVEHTSHKFKFFSELARIAAPGAFIIITTCCHRDLSLGEESLNPDEKNLLKKICNGYPLSISCSSSDYVKIAQSLALQDFKMADWSEHVTIYWEAMNRFNWRWRNLTSLLLSGWNNIKAALAIPSILEAYSKKLIKFTVIACRKPE